MKWSRSTVLAAFGASTVLGGCSEKPGGGIVEVPVPGVMLAVVTTPHLNDHALLVELSGPGITGLTAARSGYTVYSRAAGGVVKAAAFGNLQSGALLTFSVPDVSKVSQYSARVLEASGPENMLREGTSGYSVQFVPQH